MRILPRRRKTDIQDNPELAVKKLYLGLISCEVSIEALFGQDSESATQRFPQNPSINYCTGDPLLQKPGCANMGWMIELRERSHDCLASGCKLIS